MHASRFPEVRVCVSRVHRVCGLVCRCFHLGIYLCFDLLYRRSGCTVTADPFAFVFNDSDYVNVTASEAALQAAVAQQTVVVEVDAEKVSSPSATKWLALGFLAARPSVCAPCRP